MQTATSETVIKSRYLSICVHHYTLRAPCPKGQGNDRDIFVAMRNRTLTQIWRFGIHQCNLKRQLPLTDAAARRRRSGALIPAVQDAEYLI